MRKSAIGKKNKFIHIFDRVVALVDLFIVNTATTPFEYL